MPARCSPGTAEKAEQPHDQDFPQLGLHGVRIEFGPGQERQQDRSDGGDDPEPLLVGAQPVGPEGKGGDDADADFHQCQRDAQVAGQHGGQHGHRQPGRRQGVDVFHGSPLQGKRKNPALRQGLPPRRLDPCRKGTWQESLAHRGRFSGGLHPRTTSIIAQTGPEVKGERKAEGGRRKAEGGTKGRIKDEGQRMKGLGIES